MRQNKNYIRTEPETDQDSSKSDLREHSIRLQKNYKSLVEEMGSSLHIVDKLFSEDVIGREEQEQIMATELTTTERNRLIIEKLIPKNKICYRTFLEVIRDDDCDSALADEIEQTDVNQNDIILLMIGRDKINDRMKDLEKVKELQEKVQRLEIDVNESIPKNVKDHIYRILQSWKSDNMQFLSTRASMKVMECLQSNKCVTVLGNPGVGKTVTTQYAALKMQKMGYEVIPVTVPKDIRDFYSKGRRTIFVIDDLCGNYTANYQSIEEWKLWLRDIETVLEDEYCKIIATCRLQVFKDTKMAELPLFRICVCNLNADDLCLTLDEKTILADVFFENHSKKAVTMAETCDFFPLMCKLYKRNKTNLDFNLDDFLKHPFSVFENELNSLFVAGNEGKYKYCALLLCVIYDNSLSENYFTTRDLVFNENIETVCEACELNKGTSKLVFRKALDLLNGTFISKECDIYRTIHDKLFDFIGKYFGTRHIDCLLDCCASSFIKERFSYPTPKEDTNAEFSITLPVKCTSKYILRVISEWSKGHVSVALSNINMKNLSFRTDLLKQLKGVDTSVQSDLARKKDNRNIDDNALLQSCFVGDQEITSWILEYENDCNKSRPNGESPLLIASYMNHLPIVKLLINHGAEINQSKKNNVSPLFMASQAGHIAVVDFLLSCNANVNVCRSDGQTALGVAAMHDHCSIAKRLIDKGADVNKSSNIGMTPLQNACHGGHIETVRRLIENGADVNICSQTNSPLYTACYIKHVSIVNALISAGADLNKSILNGFTPLYIACNTAEVELVNALIDNGASVNTYTQLGYTPLYVAICSGNINIVNKLIEGGADVNIGVKGGASPLYKACHNKQSSIANTLIDEGADVTLCLAHEHCHTL
ncbi:putative ankyrin repeat protein RF_0381 [Mytilus trossulus]|uniref:putative ankyrin repeat protein RF_0381 n=1 Tax=Mytilus trossulus TaxID=6551 RepID=UPI003007348C